MHRNLPQAHTLLSPSPFPQKPQLALLTPSYLEGGSHIGEVCNAASDDEDLAWIGSKNEVKVRGIKTLELSPGIN